MREKLEQYVQLLFAGAADSEDIQQEILQNTLDRYDDLIAAGKVPEAAYRLAIAGIGDINEILGNPQPVLLPVSPAAPAQPQADEEERRKRLRAIAVGLYIISAIPLILFGEAGLSTLGLCLTLCIVAVATILIMLSGKKEPEQEKEEETMDPKAKVRHSVRSLIWIFGTGIYLVLSFSTRCWHITWLIFPICGAVWALVSAIWDYKEAIDDET